MIMIIIVIIIIIIIIIIITIYLWQVGPDGVPNWVLREYADFLADPVCSILNSSFAEQKLPSQWKHADVTPLTKVKPVTVVSKHIRPISLTPSLSKVAEDFVVHAFVAQ